VTSDLQLTSYNIRYRRSGERTDDRR